MKYKFYWSLNFNNQISQIYIHTQNIELLKFFHKIMICCNLISCLVDTLFVSTCFFYVICKVQKNHDQAHRMQETTCTKNKKNNCKEIHTCKNQKPHHGELGFLIMHTINFANKILTCMPYFNFNFYFYFPISQPNMKSKIFYFF